MMTGIVLCGGASSRMGQPKALLEIDGETFLSRSVQIVSSVCNRVIVVAGPNQELPVLPDQIEICRDLVEHCGPARALISALENCLINSDHAIRHAAAAWGPLLSSKK